MGGIVIKRFAFVLILGCEKISHLPIGFSSRKMNIHKYLFYNLRKTMHVQLLFLKIMPFIIIGNKVCSCLSLQFFISFGINILTGCDSLLIFLSLYHLTGINFLLVPAIPDTDRESLSKELCKDTISWT